MDLRQRRDLYNGFGDGLALAFELALTPAVFGGLGWLADRALGTTPLFTLVLLVFAFCGVGYMTWFRYEASMRAEEEQAVWRRRERPA